MILETVRLLQEGQLEQAEYLLLEGALPFLSGLDCTSQLITSFPHGESLF